jgi:hypothetical protein
MSRIGFATVMIFAALVGRAQETPGLLGRIAGTTYYSANGAYSIEIPVLPELGGVITDTKDVVVFEDAFSTHITIAAFPQDATQRWRLSSLGMKEYLIYFFTDFVLSDFRKAFKGAQVESTARFVPGILGGALITYVLLPGGSMFADRLHIVDANWTPPVAKRGNLIFVKNGFIFVVSIELAERVTEGKAYRKTSDEEDVILHDRLIDTAGKIQLKKP